MSNFFLRCSVALIAAFSALLSPAFAQPTTKELAEARLQAAKAAYRLYEERMRKQAGVFDEERYYLLAKRILAAQLDLATKKEHRLAAYQEHLARMGQLERRAKQAGTGGQIGADGVASAQYFRTEAEWLLARAQKE